MQETQTSFPQDLYVKHLSTLNNIHFTAREIDVMACLLSARRTSKTALFLSIDPRTVETHIRNIMSKIGCNTREGIIDFIEASDKHPLLRKYYSLLRMNALFEKSLKDIAKLNRGNHPRSFLIQDKDPFTLRLKSHLELAGITVSVGTREKKGDYTLCVLPQMLKDEALASYLLKIAKSQNKILLLLRETKNLKEIPQELIKWDLIYFGKQENYFFAFFLILNKLLPHLDLGKTTKEFKEKYKKTFIDYNFSQAPLHNEQLKKRSLYQRWGYLFSVSFLIALLGTGFLVFSWNQNNNQTTTIRSDLAIPIESVFLNRSELMVQIDEAFKRKQGIQTIALVGVGGSGKTTTARQYAHQQKAPLIWEINAETKSNIIESFENLARTLATREEEKRTLRDLADIKNAAERENRMVEFVKGHLKAKPNWFLIYDNVENFTDVQKYFPLDTQTWGQGKVILTTRDSNIQNNKYVNHTFQIDELSDTQKLDLFTKIMTQGSKNSFTSTQIEEAKKFLKSIPPFPLDVSVASYYIKTVQIPYEKYLEDLKENNPDLANLQNDILKESGDYIKTRYSIVTLSLQKLMASHKDFADLLVFITLLDYRNIPKDLLYQYKDNNTVDSFIYHLKKYSLVTKDSTSSTEVFFSIHRNSQDIAFAYFTELFKLKKDSPLLKKMSDTLDDYVDMSIEQEDFSKMRLMAVHLEKFLVHPDLLPDFSKGLLESKLANIYYISNDDKTPHVAAESLNRLNSQSLGHLSCEDRSRLARVFLHIGAVYTELRLYKKAEELFEQAVHIYGNERAKNYTELSWAFSHLGNVHRRIGNYEKARDYLEKSAHLNKKFGSDRQRIARTLAYLGSTYRGLGFYQKAIDTLEESLAVYKKDYSKDHYRAGWILMQLGNIYRKLGNYGKSRDYLEQSLKIHQKHFDENHIRMGWVLFHLARTYKTMGNHTRAQKLFDQVLKIYAKNCGEENVESARLLRDMAKIYFERNSIDQAETLIKRSLKILQRINHIDAFKSLEILGEIYLTKSHQLSDPNNSQESWNLKNKAIFIFNQALKITEQRLPKNSSLIKRIRNRITNVQK